HERDHVPRESAPRRSHGGRLRKIGQLSFQVHLYRLYLKDILSFAAWLYLLLGLERSDSHEPLPKECGRCVNERIIIGARARRFHSPAVGESVNVENVRHTHRGPVVEGREPDAIKNFCLRGLALARRAEDPCPWLGVKRRRGNFHWAR